MKMKMIIITIWNMEYNDIEIVIIVIIIKPRNLIVM